VVEASLCAFYNTFRFVYAAGNAYGGTGNRDNGIREQGT